jgi:hypothetical protein
MAIEIRAYFRRLAGTGVGLLMGVLSVCGAAGGQTTFQPPVTTASVVTIPSNNSWGQIFKILFYDGNVLALDAGVNALYQLSPGQTTWSILVTSGTVLGSTGGFTADGMAIDAKGTLYITARYTSATLTPTGSYFLRVPYDPVGKTWHVTASDGWGSNIVDNSTGNNILDTDEVVFVDSALKDGSGTLYWMSENEQIYMLPVDASGNAKKTVALATPIVSNLVADQGKLAVDVNGNIYFLENRATTNSSRDTGIFFIPAGQNNLSGEGPPIERIDAGQATSTTPIVYGGLTLDAAGNLYTVSENNSNYNETVAGIWMIPNECGSPKAVTKASCLNWNDISLLSTAASNAALTIDPRGYLWIPTYHDPSFDGSNPYPNVWGIVVLAPGSINLGASPALTTGPAVQPGPTGTVFFNFNQPVTPSAFQLSQSGVGSDFLVQSTDPNAPATPPTTPSGCAVGTTYTAQASCEYWVALNARKPGAISGQLTMSGMVGTSTTAAFVPGSTAYLSGIGQGAEAAMLASPAQTTIAGAAAGLVSPAQVAVDSLGNTYVADPGLKEVLYFKAGSSGATGTSVGNSLSAPTGVAVDGSGDVYIADHNKVIEIPAVNGSIAGQTQTTIASGLGTHLNLAVDGIGDVYVADPDNLRVVKIPSPAADLIPIFTPSPITVGSGFTAPSAVAVDSSGDVFVADGANLWEVMPVPPFSVQTEIITTLNEPVTGLAVDASGSVIVSQSGGILRIPSISGTLTVNSAGPLAGTITAPNGVALDQSGNIYVADMTNGPNLYELAVSGAVSFGDALTPTEQATAEVALFDIGNLPLTVNGPSTFTGPDAVSGASDFAALTGGTCDITGATPVATGSSCTVEAGFTPPTKGNYPTGGGIDLMIVPTNAGNVGGGHISAALSGTALQNLEPTQTTVSVTPATSTYPGSTTATVAVTPAPTASIPATQNVPSGTVTLTLTSLVPGSTYSLVLTGQAAGTDAGTTATFPLSNILGGPYCVTAAYAGNVGQLFQPSQSAACAAGTPSFTVAPATPVVALSEPLGISPNKANGVYYVQQGQNSITLTANVSGPSGTSGTPTGSIVFTSGANLASNGTVVGTSPLDGEGNAVFNTGTLAIGSYSIFANYSGDQNFGPNSSPVIAFQVVLKDGVVLITANPASVSTPAGTPVTSTLTLQSVAGFGAPNGDNILCDNTTLPYYSECTFNIPQPIICAPTPGNTCTGITTTVVTISSNIPVNLPPAAARVQTHGFGNSPIIPAGIFGLGLFGLAMRRRAIFSRKLLNGAGLALMLIGITMGFGGCTNSSYTQTIHKGVYPTPSGTYKVSILVEDPVSGAVQSLPFTLPLTIQ